MKFIDPILGEPIVQLSVASNSSKTQKEFNARGYYHPCDRLGKVLDGTRLILDTYYLRLIETSDGALWLTVYTEALGDILKSMQTLSSEDIEEISEEGGPHFFMRPVNGISLSLGTPRKYRASANEESSCSGFDSVQDALHDAEFHMRENAEEIAAKDVEEEKSARKKIM